MSVAAILLVKDEADVIEATIRHLFTQVDYVYVADNMSSDGTTAILEEIAASGAPMAVSYDNVVAYTQAEKTTSLALDAYRHGFSWVVPCDADEIWYTPFGRVADVLESQPDEVLFARAVVFNHITTSSDPAEDNPVRRLGWRFRDPGLMVKMACRTSPDLRIDMGNHDAETTGHVRASWSHTIHGQLVIRHFPWRSEAQHLSKITNGSLAYAAATGLDPTYGEHWKAFGLPGSVGFDARVNGWFWQWGYRANPELAEDLIYDPAPVRAEMGERD